MMQQRRLNMKLNKSFNGISTLLGIFAGAVFMVLIKILISSGVFSSMKRALFHDAGDEVKSVIEFAHPKLLYLLLLLIPLAVWYFFRRKRMTANMQISTIEAFQGVKKSYKYYMLHLPFVLRLGVIALLIIALARPQSSSNWSDRDVEGIDIVMAMDISGSMIAEDLKPNRLEAAKSVGVDFITSRPNDNIGIVVFAGESFTLSPMTTDKGSLVSLMNNISDEMIDADGTAIGMGLANAVNRIKDSQAKSKVIILLTDGSNNTGEVDPLTAAELAKTFNIRVYTIGVGTKGLAPYPVRTVFGIQRQNVKVEIDEKTLQTIADKTNGKYFRATDNKSLKAIYAEIDQMEKTKIQVTEYSKKQEEFLPYVIGALLLLLLEIILQNTVLRHIP